MYPYEYGNCVQKGYDYRNEWWEDRNYRRDEWTDQDSWARFYNIVQSVYLWESRPPHNDTIHEIYADVIDGPDGRLWAESVLVRVLEHAVADIDLDRVVLERASDVCWKAVIRVDSETARRRAALRG
jgi:hypothetical protein